MTYHTLDALRRLAERPGTEHEGIVAREMLAKLEGKRRTGDRTGDTRFRTYEEAYAQAYRDFAEKKISMEEFLRAMRLRNDDYLNHIPTEWTCACGTVLPVGTKCTSTRTHWAISEQIKDRFKKGDRVFYNKWAYSQNDPGYVAAYVPQDERVNCDFPWNWISVRFNRLKSARRIPVISELGWHLTKEPVSDDVYRRMARVL